MRVWQLKKRLKKMDNNARITFCDNSGYIMGVVNSIDDKFTTLNSIKCPQVTMSCTIKLLDGEKYE